MPRGGARGGGRGRGRGRGNGGGRGQRQTTFVARPDDDELVARRHLGLGFRKGKTIPGGAHSLQEPIIFVSAGFLEPDAVDVEEAVATAPCEADGTVTAEAPAPQAASAVDAEAEGEPEPLMSAPRNAFEALGDAGTDDESDDESDDASEEESEEEGEEEEGEADGLDDLSYEDLQKILLMDLGSTNGASSGEDDAESDDDDDESEVESEEEAEEAAAPPASLLPVAGASSDESPSLRDLLEAFAAEPCTVELTLRRPTAKGGIAEVAWLADHFDCECTSERRGGAKLLVIRKDGFDDDGDGHALAFTPTTRLTKKQRRQLKRGHTTTPKHLRKQLRQAQWERAAEARGGRGRGGGRGAAAGAAAAGAAAAAAAAARLRIAEHGAPEGARRGQQGLPVAVVDGMGGRRARHGARVDLGAHRRQHAQRARRSRHVSVEALSLL